MQYYYYYDGDGISNKAFDYQCMLLLPFKYLRLRVRAWVSEWVNVNEYKSVSKIHKIKRTFAHFQHFNCGIERNKKENTHSKQIETINRALAIKNSEEKVAVVLHWYMYFLSVCVCAQRARERAKEYARSHVEILCNHKRSKNTNFSFHCP